MNEFFDVRKVANNKIELTQMKPVIGLLSPMSRNFTNKVTNSLPITDYDLLILDVPEEKKTIYTYNFKDGYDPANKFIQIDLNNQGLSDEKLNALPAHSWQFPVDKKGDLVSNSSIISPLLAAAIIPAVVAPLVTAPVVAPVTELPLAPVYSSGTPE